MYPCSNPELIAAVSNSGAIGIVQPISLTYIHNYDFREGLRFIKTLTDQPIGMNALIEKSSRNYIKKMSAWIDIALEEGVRFFITSLGNPKWVVDKVHACGGIVYHDVTEAKWADIAIKAGVDGFIAVNNAAGGHAGSFDAKELFQMLQKYHLPLICAGGIGNAETFREALALGYDGVQMGTRFIASHECTVPLSYKNAIIKAHATDIIHTKELTGIPVSVIASDHDKERGVFSTFLLHNKMTKRLMRLFFALKALRHGKKTMTNKVPSKQTKWVAGKSVQTIESIQSVANIIKSFQS